MDKGIGGDKHTGFGLLGTSAESLLLRSGEALEKTGHAMPQILPKQDFLLLSRGKWDEDKSPDQIQAAIDRFYAWYEQALTDGRMKPGQRLGTQAKLVTRGKVIDGPFTEAKEVVGGYWFIVAGSLEEAAAIAAENPCLACGLMYEIRPIDPQRGSAYGVSNETRQT